jgi:hypothetical protein
MVCRWLAEKEVGEIKLEEDGDSGETVFFPQGVNFI